MPPKEAAPKARPKSKSAAAGNARGDDGDDGDNGVAAAAARACAEESRRLVDVSVTRGVRHLLLSRRSRQVADAALYALLLQLLSRAKAVAPRELPISDGARLRCWTEQGVWHSLLSHVPQRCLLPRTPGATW